MRHLYFIFCATMFSLSGSFVGCEKSTEPNSLTIADAERAVFINVLSNNDSGKVVYELPNILKAGSVINCRQLDSTDFIAPSDSWFFFIDDNPNMYWVHPCRYVFINASSAKATIHNWTYKPTCIGEMKIVGF